MFEPYAADQERREINDAPRTPTSLEALRSRRAQTAVGAVAFGALAVGAIAFGAIAIGRLAIGALALKRGHVRTLRVDDLEVGRLHIRELVNQRS